VTTPEPTRGSSLIVVSVVERDTGIEHPGEDAWVLERAGEEADKSGKPLPPYQGRATMANGFEVHIYGAADVADRARINWAEHARTEQP
jgi:hypothetical protein